jgi:D-sedoheptulose 7-phosphate isomerase
MDNDKTRDNVKEYRIMKEAIIKELDENISTTRSLSKNLLDTIVITSRTIIDCYRNGGKVILIGNGGSAADAQHIAAELVGRFKLERDSLPAVSLTTNTSIITALANDYGYETIFSHQLESFANDKDILIAITTSGNSPNILNAVKSAKLKNIKVVGMTGKTGGKLKDIVDISIRVPSDNTPRIQEAHITIGHIICGIVENELTQKI